MTEYFVETELAFPFGCSWVTDAGLYTRTGFTVACFSHNDVVWPDEEYFQKRVQHLLFYAGPCLCTYYGKRANVYCMENSEIRDRGSLKERESNNASVIS